MVPLRVGLFWGGGVEVLGVVLEKGVLELLGRDDRGVIFRSVANARGKYGSKEAL